MSRHYIGVIQITVDSTPISYHEYREKYPSERMAHETGFVIRNSSGRISWVPEEVLRQRFLPMGEGNDGSKITAEMVNQFIASTEVKTLGRKTTVLATKLANGFEIVESSSCVDANNYDEGLGADICRKRVKDQVWHLLGFLLQSARNGFSR